MVSAVLLNPNANPESITQFHDELSNELPELKGNWGFSFKIFRNNPYSIAPELAGAAEQSKEAKFLHTLSPSYLYDSGVCLINKRSAAIYTGAIQEEIEQIGTHLDTPIPNKHLHQGATTGLNDPFDMLISQKLQSLWLLRQTIRGDGGQIYQLENGNLIIRTANVFLHGIFKGLLIEIVVDDHIIEKTDHQYLETVFGDIMAKYKIPRGKLCHDVLDDQLLDQYGDLCLQYAEILNF